jgi:predicted Rdx family selenoprotein
MSSGQTDWVMRAAEVAQEVLAPHADGVDREGRWPSESVVALGQSGLLGRNRSGR